MKKILYLTILFSQVLFVSSLTRHLHCEEPSLKLKFNDLETLNHADGKVVEIRGFLYEDKQGKKILSNEPNLRTCCVGAKSKRKKQILVTGKIGSFSPQYPITLQGLFYIAEEAKEDGNSTQPLYQIENAVVIRVENNTGKKTSLFMLLTAISVGALFCVFRLRRS